VGILSFLKRKKKPEKYHTYFNEEDFRKGYMPDPLNGVKKHTKSMDDFQPIPKRE